MGDRSHVILEKSRTVRRRYQRRKQQVVFSKEELARLERAEERDRRAKKLQEQEKRRVANKKKRLEKEALAREERKKSGLPDPNVKISASQKLLSNFFGMGGGGGGGGERDKSESTGEDGGDTEVDTDDSFDDDDALTLFNDEDVLKGINSGGIGNDTPEPSAGKQTESMLNSQRLSSCGNESKPHIESDQTSGTEKRQTADQLALKPTDANGDKGKQPPATGVKLTSQTTAKITDSVLFADDVRVEEMVHSGSANISQDTQPTDLYQDAEDVLAGLCTQDFDDDDDDDEEKEEKKEKEKGKEEEERTGQAQVRSQHRASGGDKQQAQQQPLSDLAPTSLNIKNAETTTTTTTTCVQKQQDTSKTTTIHPQTTTTTTSAIDDDEYGSFSFSNEDLLSLGV